MKRIFALLIAISMAVSLSACGTGDTASPAGEESDPPDSQAEAAPIAESEGPQEGITGTFAGEATGFGGPLKLELDMEASRITEVRITEHNETEGVGTTAVERLPEEIVATQSIALDAVSGCTVTSGAVLDATADALAAAGANVDDYYITPDSGLAQGVQDEETDIVIVGGGGAGMAAAIEATSRGARVILIEKQPMLGGTTNLASTAYNAGGTSVQLDMDPPYTATDYYEKLLGVKEEDESLRMLADRSATDGDWLIGMGADLNRVINGSQHTPEDGGALGTMLVPVLKAKLDELAVDYRTEHRGVALVLDGDVVTGIEVQAPGGSYVITAKAVILSTGGFASSPEMVDKYTPQWSGYPSTASVGATGDGIVMALEAGAALGNMDASSPQTVAFDTGSGAVSLTNVRYNGAILVNREGRRFVDELSATDALGAAIKEQTGGDAFLIFDQVSVDNASLMQEYKDKGYFTEAATLEELAEKLGLDASALEETVQTWQESFDAGEDAAFGRTDSMFSRIDTPSYYGSLISPANQTTNGGVRIDLQARALGEDGTPIQGLYIGGETADQAGHGVTVAIVIGRLAAETAVADMA